MARNHTRAAARFPSTPAQLAECLADPVSAADVFGSSPQAWQDFAGHYAKASPQLAELAQLEAQRQLQDLGGRAIPRGIGGAASNGGRGRFYNRKAAGVALDSILPPSENPWAQFVQTTNPRNEGAQPLRAQLANSMSERVPAEGGSLVPEVLRSDLLQLSLEQSIIRGRCHIVPMDSLRVPFPAIDDVSHATSVYGGVVAFWAEEGAALTQSAPSFARVVLTARKLAAYTAIPNELMEDNAESLLQDWLTTASDLR